VPIVTRFTEMFGCRHPLQQAGMGGVATPDLAIAVARAGGLGMLSGTVGRAGLAVQLDDVPAELPIGVNFLVPFLDRTAVVEAAARCRFVEFFWGTPDPELVGVVHDGGARAGWQVGSTTEAEAAADAGCDVVVVQGVEAGGHVRGSLPLVGLLDDVRRVVVDVPIIAAGGIGTGRAMAAALEAGADAVRVGTRFVAAVETSAHPVYVDALIAADAEDTVLTTAFGDGWPDAPHRVLKSSVEAGEKLGDRQSWSPDWPASTYVGPAEARALYAGLSVGAVRERTTAAEIVAEIVDEAERVLGR
jgi:nitronate monooxygenase